MKVHRLFAVPVILFLYLQQGLFASDSLLFVSPVDHDVRLSGNFMELRKNHFHTGIDIKSSNGKVGDPIKVVAEGHISRIKVQNGSYGQVLYIDHPHGYTTVYAHLNCFTDEVESYIKEVQYELESYEVDLYLPDSLFVLESGEYIGQMGNTGRSFGPHLHFEIRDTETEKPLNPEDFGFAPDDNISPELQSLEIYYLDQERKVQSSETRYFRKNGDAYNLFTPVIIPDSLSIAFGLQCFDQINGSYNRNGINSYQIYLEDSLIYDWAAKDYSFWESKKINGFIDYNKYIQTGVRIYKLYQTECSMLDYFKSKGSGILQFKNFGKFDIRIDVSDAQNNKTSLNFEVEHRSGIQLDKSSFPCDSGFVVKRGMFEIQFPASSFFHRPDVITIEKSQEQIMGQNCHKLQILDRSTALSKYIKVNCPLPPSDISHWCYITRDNRGRWVSFTADSSANNLSAYIDQCGTFYLYKDTEAPVIETLKLDIRDGGSMIFRIKDNLIPDGRTPDLNYEARANGKWMRFIYDLKTDRIIFKDMDLLPDGIFEFELIVRDGQNNESILRKKMFKS